MGVHVAFFCLITSEVEHLVACLLFLCFCEFFFLNNVCELPVCYLFCLHRTEIENSNSNLYIFFLQDLEKMFEITVDSHAVVKSNTARSYVPLPSFPHGSIVQNCSTVSQQDIDIGTVRMRNVFITRRILHVALL